MFKLICFVYSKNNIEQPDKGFQQFRLNKNNLDLLNIFHKFLYKKWK